MTQEKSAIEAGKTAVVGELQDVAHVLTLGAHSFPCAQHMPIGTMLRLSTKDISAFEMYHHLLVKLIAGPKVQVGLDPITDAPILEPAAMTAVWDACDEMAPDDVMTAIGALLDSYTERPTQPESPSVSGPPDPADPS